MGTLTLGDPCARQTGDLISAYQDFLNSPSSLQSSWAINSVDFTVGLTEHPGTSTCNNDCKLMTQASRTV